jgi:S-methylmethionine-dependent homocysteine/selenocysteine methylase
MTGDVTGLPQLSGSMMLTDGGLETDLIFHRGFTLEQFAAFPLLGTDAGRAALCDYYTAYIEIADAMGVGVVLESPTWRANPDWGPLLGYDPQALDEANGDAIALMCDLRARHADHAGPLVVSGCIGPRGDGYVVGEAMDPDEARAYHQRQIGVFAASGADMVTAITMTSAEEAIGVVRAAQVVNIPVVVSFTVETDGRLPSGQALPDAIRQVDESTDLGAAYFMINCAHPSHFAHVIEPGADWAGRIMGLRANASVLSHAELDQAEELDEGDPQELGQDHAALRALLPNVKVLGGCCGTDHRHVSEIARAWLIGP